MNMHRSTVLCTVAVRHMRVMASKWVSYDEMLEIRLVEECWNFIITVDSS